MKKTTKEYAEKLANESIKHINPHAGDGFGNEIAGVAFHSFTEGYLKCSEENAVPELIEVLGLAKSALQLHGHTDGNIVMKQINQVLNKINP